MSRLGSPGRQIKAMPLHITAQSSTNGHSGRFSSGGNSSTSSPKSRSNLKHTTECISVCRSRSLIKHVRAVKTPWKRRQHSAAAAITISITVHQLAAAVTEYVEMCRQGASGPSRTIYSCCTLTSRTLHAAALPLPNRSRLGCATIGEFCNRRSVQFRKRFRKQEQVGYGGHRDLPQIEPISFRDS